ncbi:MAG: NAD-dependent epimerase/dehydratase family protein [Planctomycetota bacterium]|nr:MAG: NAD-dependent epimerase/dehydratase family protein [Planctomycetota bacterium]
MRALVTGGAGFIGAWLVRCLHEQGAEVRVLERPGADPRAIEGLPVEWVEGDVRDRDAVRRALADRDHLFHLAGNPNLWTYPRTEFESVNHQGTRRVLDEAARRPLARIVFTSTESILVGRRPGGPIDENAAPELEDMVGPYCRSKLLAERAAFAAAREGQPVVIVNPTLPVGPGDRNRTPPGRMIEAFLAGRIRGYVEATLNFVDVRDVAEGHVLACLRGSPGRRVILGGEDLALSAFFALLSAESGIPAPAYRVPYAVALAYAFCAERVADWITHRPPLASVTGLRLARRGMRFDCARAREELGFAPRPVRESIRDAVRWYRERAGAGTNSARGALACP